jgi:hypothetical protein
MAQIHPSAASTDFSTQHFDAAEVFASETSRIEAEFQGKEREVDTVTRHLAFASGTVLSAVAFLEAYINEIFYHCALTLGGVPISGLNKDQQALLGRMWRRGIPRTARYTVTDKYEVALDLLAKEPFDRGKSNYQAVKSLVDLRNALIHYEPEMYPIPGPRNPQVPQDAMPKLESSLRGKFALNPFAREDFGFFPDKCLSAGCATWAVNASASFALEFVTNAGIVERWKNPVASLQARA